MLGVGGRSEGAVREGEGVRVRPGEWRREGRGREEIGGHLLGQLIR